MAVFGGRVVGPFVSFYLLLYVYLNGLCTRNMGVMCVNGDVARNTLLGAPMARTPPMRTDRCVRRTAGRSITFQGYKMDKAAALSFLPVTRERFPGMGSTTRRLDRHGKALLFSVVLNAGSDTYGNPFNSPIRPISCCAGVGTVVSRLLSLCPRYGIIVRRPV